MVSSGLSARTTVWFVALAVLFSGSAVLAREADGEDRLLVQFVKDGEVISRGWLEGRSDYQGWGDGDRAMLSSLLAFTFASDFEVGLAFGGMWVDPDHGDSEEGFSDTQVFGKVRLMEKPVILSVGTIISLPTGDEEEGTGTGELDMEFFGALRRVFKPMTLVANGGFRVNQDVDVHLEPGGFPSGRSGGETEGKVSGFLGAGLLFLAGERWSFQAELYLETKRYDGYDSDVRFTPGVTFRTARASLRGGVSIGLTDGAPDYSLLGSAVFRF